MRFIAPLLGMALTVTSGGLVLAAGAAAPTAAGCAVFPANNVWNADISKLPIDPRGGAWLASMHAATKRLHPDFGAAPYGIPWTAVSAAQPRVSVKFDYADESDPGPYPFDGNTPIEGGQNADGDRHALMLDSDRCMLYELYDAHWNNGTPRAGSGAVFDLTGNTLRPAKWTSADAAGLPIFPGLLRWEEVQAGAINHAIRFTAQRTDKSFVWPARHQAGARSDPTLPPMGARFRLKASFDGSAYSGPARVVITALQHYGLILADNGSDWFFQGTQDGRWNDSLLDQLKTIPAAAFEVVDESSLTVDPNSAAVAPSSGS